MERFRFLEWKVYRDAKEVVSIILRMVAELPKEYRFEMGNQVIRSSLSIVLNIAEGSGKGSDKDFNHFLNISLGSLNETLAALDIFKDNKLIKEEKFREVKAKLESIANQLGGFKKKLTKGQK
ncbi:four helix bundle protein [Candidatus Parcubacteria bacterium]|nr:MAG: four helix bundle protein [Candidatus Parcubacteria bacterium]